MGLCASAIGPTSENLDIPLIVAAGSSGDNLLSPLGVLGRCFSQSLLVFSSPLRWPSWSGASAKPPSESPVVRTSPLPPPPQLRSRPARRPSRHDEQGCRVALGRRRRDARRGHAARVSEARRAARKAPRSVRRPRVRPPPGSRGRRPGTCPILRDRAAVAQLARASACHAEGREFESLQPLRRSPRRRGGFFVQGPPKRSVEAPMGRDDHRSHRAHRTRRCADDDDHEVPAVDQAALPLPHHQHGRSDRKGHRHPAVRHRRPL
jgi:hypothetical protein